MLVAERLEQHSQPRRVDADEILDPGAQRRRRQVAGVEAVAECADLWQAFALEFDRLGQRAIVAGKWMPAPGFRKALDQRIGLGVEIQKANRPAICARIVDGAGKSSEPGFGLYVEYDRDPILRRRLQLRKQRGQ